MGIEEWKKSQEAAAEFISDDESASCDSKDEKKIKNKRKK